MNLDITKEHIVKSAAAVANFRGSRGVGSGTMNPAAMQFQDQHRKQNAGSYMSILIQLAKEGAQNNWKFKTPFMRSMKHLMSLDPGSEEYKRIVTSPKFQKVMANPEAIAEQVKSEPQVKAINENDTLRKLYSGKASHRVQAAGKADPVNIGFTSEVMSTDNDEMIGGVPADYYKSNFKHYRRGGIGKALNQGNVAEGVNKNVDYTSPIKSFFKGDKGLFELGGDLFKKFTGVGNNSNTVV